MAVKLQLQPLRCSITCVFVCITMECFGKVPLGQVSCFDMHGERRMPAVGLQGSAECCILYKAAMAVVGCFPSGLAACHKRLLGSACVAICCFRGKEVFAAYSVGSSVTGAPCTSRNAGCPAGFLAKTLGGWDQFGALCWCVCCASAQDRALLPGRTCIVWCTVWVLLLYDVGLCT